MKKNIYLIILTIITVVCILAGTFYHLLGWGSSFLGRFFSWGGSSSGPMIEDETELDAFDSISIDADVMSLVIQTGDTASIYYNCNEKLKPAYEVKDHKLFLTQNISSKRFLHGPNKCTVTLTLPASQEYQNITINSDVGDIKIKNIKGQTLSATADVGEIHLKSCDINDMTLTADVGDIRVDHCNPSSMKIDCSVGDTKITNLTDLENYKIEANCGVGTVKVNNGSHSDHYTQHGNGSKTLTVQADTGDIRILEND